MQTIAAKAAAVRPARASVAASRPRRALAPTHITAAPRRQRGDVRVAAAGAAQQTFLEELRDYAMKLHTKSQAPKEGQAPEKREQKPFAPTREGFLAFMVESKVVYDAFEDIMRQPVQPEYASLANTGLERGEALAKDIAHMEQQYGLQAPVPAPDGPGHTYAKLLRELAASSPPAFLCHYYNHYFAHTAGGRMIGKSVSNSVLDGWTGAFYTWEGDVKALLDAVRVSINGIAEGWSREQRDACLQETPATFGWGGKLVSLIQGGQPMGH